VKINKRIESVSFVGSGNVATHLANTLSKIGVNIVEVFSRKTENAKIFAERFSCSVVNSLSEINPQTDLIIIAVPDSKIKSVSGELKFTNTLVVHTSGITKMEILDSNNNYGVFYPLQTFSKSREVEMNEIPFCIEAKNKSDFDLLAELASRISNNVKEVSSEQRKVLHLTAVMVNNFSNHMYHLAHGILEHNDLSFDFLLPLIHETALKVKSVHPKDAQTGPARRKDDSTMNEHLKMLNGFPEYQEIYKLLSQQIMKKYYE
jgi:predicted short-subunit dehydrogenase-like oxidoreductase (DUF2520 family)